MRVPVGYGVECGQDNRFSSDELGSRSVLLVYFWNVGLVETLDGLEATLAACVKAFGSSSGCDFNDLDLADKYKILSQRNSTLKIEK